jgi:NADH:ubiquinone oxidoreductase subunit 6 (subunit J)
MGSTEAIGSVLYTVYFVPFLTTALLLLVAMVGAVVIAARER